MATRITQDELLKALAQAMAPSKSEEAPTVEDLVVATGWSKGTIIKALRDIKREGRLEIVRVVRESLDGRMWGTPGYRLKAPPKKK